MLARFGRRVWFWVRRNRIEAELREEMETHRTLREDTLRRHGHDTARTASRRAMGNTVLAREDARGVWLWPWLESVVLDVRHGVRSLAHHPTFAATGLLTVAIGTGALTAGFALAHTVLVKATPYDNADRVVQILEMRDGRLRYQVSSADLEALSAATSLEGVTFAAIGTVNLTGDELPENARAIYTNEFLFPVLGTAPTLGRWPTSADANGAAPPVVLSHRLWQRRYLGRTDIIGTPVTLNGRAHMIVAVMPEPFLFPAPYYISGDLWLLRDAAHPSLREPDRPVLLGFGLVKAGISRARAQAEVDAVTTGGTLKLSEWAATIRGGARATLLLLVAAAGVVFLIVCINLFNLLLCRSLDRSTELATRASLGAGSGRLVRHLVTETMVLFAAGGAAGILIAIWLAKGVAGIASFDIPRMNEIEIEWTVGLAGLALACTAGVLVGWLPALRAARLAERRTGLASRSVTHHRRGRAMQRALIASEIGLAVLLVCGASAIAVQAARLSDVDAGFNADRLVQARVSLPVAHYPGIPDQSRAFTDILARLRAHPAIESAGLTDLQPGLAGRATPAALLGHDPVPQQLQDLRPVAVRVVSEGYLETLGLRPLRGRFLTARDGQAPPVAVVNDAFVRAYLRGQPALGSAVRVTTDGLPELDVDARTIVGVAPDVKEDVLYRDAPPTVYVPMTQAPSLRMAVIIRAAAQAPDLGRVIREHVAAVAPGVAVNGLVMPVADLMQLEFTRTRVSLWLVGGLALVAVVLAIVGVYGVTAHGVQHRSREIGIRLALGVSPAAVRRMVVTEGLLLLGAGLAGGGALAVWLLPMIRSLVVGVDQIAVGAPLVAAVIILTLAVVTGSDIPARRAARVDPATALR